MSSVVGSGSSKLQMSNAPMVSATGQYVTLGPGGPEGILIPKSSMQVAVNQQAIIPAVTGLQNVGVIVQPQYTVLNQPTIQYSPTNVLSINQNPDQQGMTTIKEDKLGPSQKNDKSNSQTYDDPNLPCKCSNDAYGTFVPHQSNIVFRQPEGGGYVSYIQNSSLSQSESVVKLKGMHGGQVPNSIAPQTHYTGSTVMDKIGDLTETTGSFFSSSRPIHSNTIDPYSEPIILDNCVVEENESQVLTDINGQLVEEEDVPMLQISEVYTLSGSDVQALWGDEGQDTDHKGQDNGNQSGEYAYHSEDERIPKKRGPGRPRKYPIMPAPKLVTPPPKVRRGRGRPRKYKKSETEPAIETMTERMVEKLIEDPPILSREECFTSESVPIKPSSPNLSHKECFTSKTVQIKESSPNLSCEECFTSEIVPVKRGRGRPRKNKNKLEEIHIKICSGHKTPNVTSSQEVNKGIDKESSGDRVIAFPGKAIDVMLHVKENIKEMLKQKDKIKEEMVRKEEAQVKESKANEGQCGKPESTKESEKFKSLVIPDVVLTPHLTSAETVKLCQRNKKLLPHDQNMVTSPDTKFRKILPKPDGKSTDIVDIKVKVKVPGTPRKITMGYSNCTQTFEPRPKEKPIVYVTNNSIVKLEDPIVKIEKILCVDDATRYLRGPEGMRRGTRENTTPEGSRQNDTSSLPKEDYRCDDIKEVNTKVETGDRAQDKVKTNKRKCSQPQHIKVEIRKNEQDKTRTSKRKCLQPQDIPEESEQRGQDKARPSKQKCSQPQDTAVEPDEREQDKARPSQRKCSQPQETTLEPDESKQDKARPSKRKCSQPQDTAVEKEQEQVKKSNMEQRQVASLIIKNEHISQQSGINELCTNRGQLKIQDDWPKQDVPKLLLGGSDEPKPWNILEPSGTDWDAFSEEVNLEFDYKRRPTRGRPKKLKLEVTEKEEKREVKEDAHTKKIKLLKEKLKKQKEALAELLQKKEVDYSIQE